MPFISYLAILIISFFFNIIPRKISLLAGRIFGTTIYYLFPIRKKVALKNIKDNFPELTHRQCMKILKQTYTHFGMVLVDFLRTKQLNTRNIKKIDKMDEKTIKILNKYAGSIIMTGHIGNWEYFLPAFGLNSLKFSIVAQTIKNSYLNKLFLKIRTLKNVEIIFKEEGKEKMLRALEFASVISGDHNDPPYGYSNSQGWKLWTDKVKQVTGRAGRNLYMPLRLYLTGSEKGPDMNKLFPFLKNIKKI